MDDTVPVVFICPASHDIKDGKNDANPKAELIAQIHITSGHTELMDKVNKNDDIITTISRITIEFGNKTMAVGIPSKRATKKVILNATRMFNAS